ncbi:hypothetical protein NUSPORA_02393 [Nucleospora cyclopteri]
MYDDTIGLHNYGKGHPMNPIRISMTHSLVRSFNIDKQMDLYIPSRVKLTYHTKEYIKNLGTEETDDCPNFEGIVEYAERYSSASINGALLINSGLHDKVINWSGGLHHAHKEEPSGFCFANDIVMAIQELLCKHERVMYIDIDVHHGDGVEEAFYDNDRVLTVSFHKHGDNFFPNTGDLITSNKRAVNVPLQSGITDETYKYVFEPVIANCIRKFNPGVIVFQAGTDSLAEDKLGVFSLSVEGHASCLKFVADQNVPILVLGGGGYTIQNVARCWAYETAVLCDFPINDQIPQSDPFIEHYSPNFLIKPELITKHRINFNGKRYLDSVMSFVQERIDKFI